MSECVIAEMEGLIITIQRMCFVLDAGCSTRTMRLDPARVRITLVFFFLFLLLVLQVLN